MFRKEAACQTRWRGRVLLLPGIPFWLTAGLCLFFMLAFLIFVIAGHYTRRVNVSGEISSFPRATLVSSGVHGVVVKRFVSEGQEIKAGAALYQIDVSKSTLDGVISDNQRQDVTDQLARVARITHHLANSKASTLNMLKQQREQYDKAYQRSSQIVRQAQEGIQYTKKNMENYRRYLSQGLINKDQLTNQSALYYQQQSNLLSLSAQNEQNALQIISLESQIQTQAADFDNQIYQMELQQYELQKELLNIDANGSIIIRALADGHIDSLSVTPGQMVNIGDSLAQVLPALVDYYALVLWVPNYAIPFIRSGDSVNIRYEAFPAEKFGQFAGTVSLISTVPASPQEMLSYQGAPKAPLTADVPYYKVIVRPHKQTVNYSGRALRLENGIKAQSTLFLEKRPIYQWMLSPFYDIKHSASGAVNE